MCETHTGLTVTPIKRVELCRWVGLVAQVEGPSTSTIRTDLVLKVSFTRKAWYWHGKRAYDGRRTETLLVMYEVLKMLVKSEPDDAEPYGETTLQQDFRRPLTLWRLTTYIYIYMSYRKLTSRHCILNIYSINTLTEYFKHAAHSPFFFLFKMPFTS